MDAPWQGELHRFPRESTERLAEPGRSPSMATALGGTPCANRSAMPRYSKPSRGSARAASTSSRVSSRSPTRRSGAISRRAARRARSVDGPVDVDDMRRSRDEAREVGAELGNWPGDLAHLDPDQRIAGAPALCSHYAKACGHGVRGKCCPFAGHIDVGDSNGGPGEWVLACWCPQPSEPGRRAILARYESALRPWRELYPADSKRGFNLRRGPIRAIRPRGSAPLRYRARRTAARSSAQVHRLI